MIYRPGSKPATQKFLDELSIILEILSTYRRPIVITGDINERENNAMAIRFREMLVSFDLIIHSTTATHQCGGQLDLVITRSEMNNMQVNVLETGISDHLMLAFNVPLQKADETASSFSGRSWKGFDFDAFWDDLQTSELCVDLDKFKNESTDEIFDRYSLILKSLLNIHAPYTNKKPRRHLLTPWFDAECRAFKRSARRLERVYRRNKTLDNRLAWVKTLQAMRSFFQSKEHSYWETRVAADHKAPKKLWRNLNTILGKENSSNTCGSITPDQFAEFFKDKVALVREQTATAPPPSIPVTCKEYFDCFQPITEKEVKTLIMAAPNKCCALDPAPTWLIKRCCGYLAPFVAMMCNRSILEEHLPISQKTAIVTPLIKKEGLDPAIPKNYRPVSNLSFISMEVERTVVQQLNGFLSHTGSLPSNQSAYRQFHSTETALIKVVNDLAIASDKGQVSLLSLLDLSAAFDTVDHAILIGTHGIRDVALKWFISYLSDRTQRVVIGKNSSSLMALDSGVPQGSVLGPLLFLLYTADIISIWEDLVVCVCVCVCTTNGRPNGLPDLDQILEWIAIYPGGDIGGLKFIPHLSKWSPPREVDLENLPDETVGWPLVSKWRYLANKY